MIQSAALRSLVFATWAGIAGAQVLPGVFGHLVTGQNGTAGEFCWAFSCTPDQLTVAPGETLTLQVNAPYQAFFAIAASFSATSCLSFPGVGNMLVLDPAPVTLAIGVVGQQSPMLACWGGVQVVPLVLPPWLPSGLSFTTQALAEVPALTAATPISLSTPVTLTVQ